MALIERNDPPEFRGTRQAVLAWSRMFMLERRRGPPRVKFEKPLEGWIVAVDHACCECQVIELSHRGAQLRVPASAVGLESFLLLLSRFGCPVYRYCESKWVDGTSMGVEFRMQAASQYGELLKNMGLAGPHAVSRTNKSSI
jgi:hypothetical protein